MKKVAFIIGGSSGIGFEVCRILIEEGYIVYNGSRRECQLLGIRNIYLDVSLEMIEEAFLKIEVEEGRLDLLVYAAGFSIAAPISEITESDLNYLVEVNLLGAIKATKHSIKYLKKQSKSHIIFISSLAAVIPIAYDAYYSATKAALNTLAVALNLELNQYNINVTSIMPGGVKTNFTYKRKIYDTSDQNLVAATNKLAEIEQNGIAPQKVANEIYEIIKTDFPKIEIINGFMNKLKAILKNILPEKIFIQLLKIFYKIEEKESEHEKAYNDL